MSPLARRLRAKREEMPFREMERYVWDARKIKFTSSSFEQVANDDRAGRLTPDAIHAIAVVLELSEREVADLDDERWGITREYVTRGPSAQDQPADLTNIATDALLAEIARRAGGSNPDRR